MTTQSDRMAGGVLGLLVGDALGVPYEFHDKEAIPPFRKIEFDPPSGFERSHPGVPPGTYSDDGAQALCLLDSLLVSKRLDPEDLGRRLRDWYESGYLAVDGRVFDVGIQTRHALEAMRAGVPALKAGLANERSNGNGSLMRVLPLALWHRGSDRELVRDAHLQSKITHGHVRSQVCCAIYCLWARYALMDRADPWSVATASLRSIYADGNARALRELEAHVRPDDPPVGRGSGYVLDCLHSARMVVARGGGFERIVRSAVALGDDTDTTAAVAGGIAGVLKGVGAIPSRWIEALRGRALIDPLVSSLTSRA